MNVLVIVSVDLLFLFPRPAAKWFLQIAIRVFGANHKANLTRWVRGNRGVGVLDVREDLLAVGFELGDHREMEPLVLG